MTELRACCGQIGYRIFQSTAWIGRTTATDEFNRCAAVPIEIDDAALRALPVGGVFDANDIDSFAAFLQTLDGVRVEKTTREFAFSV